MSDLTLTEQPRGAWEAADEIERLLEQLGEKGMTDRELLEMAAKAAGIDWVDDTSVGHARGLRLKTGSFWNPLTDDGDALRLAVKLKLRWTHIIWVSPVFEPYIGDVDAATRRAIVRAAAEIGRNMA